MKIPLARPEITEADIAAVVEVLRSAHLSQGPAMHAFEDALASYLEVSHAVVVNSGTSALQLALRSLGIGHGDEVILPSFSFMAVTNAILSEGAIPVFVDIDPRTLNMSPAALEAAFSQTTRAVIVVHSFGFPAPAQEIASWARAHSLAVIEDACEALGAESNHCKVGSIGDIGVLAFYPNKLITTGEGGALITNSDVLAAHFRSLRNQGRSSGPDWLQHQELGFSYRLSDINCALGRQQLSRLQKILYRREQIAASYRRRLRATPHLSCFNAVGRNARASWFTYPVLLNTTFTRCDRDRIWTEMNERGIQCGRYFAPSHLQPALRGVRFRCGDLTQTVAIAERLLCLPLFHSLDDLSIEFICAALDEVLSRPTAPDGAFQALVNW